MNWKSNLLGPLGNWAHRANCRHINWRQTEESEVTKAEPHDRNPYIRVRKPKLKLSAVGGSVWTRLSTKLLEGSSLTQVCPRFWVFSPGALPGSHSEDSREVPLRFQHGEGNRNCCERGRSTQFLTKPILLGCEQSEGNCSMPAPSSHPAHPREGEKRNTWSSQPRGTGLAKAWEHITFLVKDGAPHWRGCIPHSSPRAGID